MGQEARGDREDDGPAQVLVGRRRRLVRPLPRLLPLPAAARLFGRRRRLPDLRVAQDARRGQDRGRGHEDHVLVPLLAAEGGHEPARLHPRVPALLLLPQAGPAVWLFSPTTKGAGVVYEKVVKPFVFPLLVGSKSDYIEALLCNTSVQT